MRDKIRHQMEGGEEEDKGELDFHLLRAGVHGLCWVGMAESFFSQTFD